MFRTQERSSLRITKALTYTFLSHGFHVYRPSLPHPSRSGDPGFLWKHAMGLASRVGEMGTFWHFLGWASFGFLWEPRGIPSNPFSLGHFALHLISAASESRVQVAARSYWCWPARQFFSRKGACGSMWDAESAGARGSGQGSSTPKHQPLLLVGYFNKNSSHRENGIFIGHS